MENQTLKDLNNPLPLRDGFAQERAAEEIDWEQQLARIKQDLFCYLSVRFDYTKASVKEAVNKVLLSLLLTVLLYGALFASLCLLMYGTALAINVAGYGDPWLGFLASGAIFFLLGVFVIRATLHKVRKSALMQKVREYERE